MPRLHHDPFEEDVPNEDPETPKPQISTTVPLPKVKKISKGALAFEMNEAFRLHELARNILEDMQAYIDYQVLPIAQNLTKEDLESLLNAMTRK